MSKRTLWYQPADEPDIALQADDLDGLDVMCVITRPDPNEAHAPWQVTILWGRGPDIGDLVIANTDSLDAAMGAAAMWASERWAEHAEAELEFANSYIRWPS